MERFLREFQKNEEQFRELTAEEMKEKLNEFTEKWNRDGGMRTHGEKDQWDYLDLAYEAEDVKTARKYAQKALSIDPYCTDAEILLIKLMNHTMEDERKRYEKLIEKTEAHLREEGYFEDDMGSFYGISETRPYMRLLREYLDLLICLGKYAEAIEQARKMLRLNVDDNLGVRYDLMALYAMLEDVDQAEKLYQAYPEDNVNTLLPLVLLYYKVDDYTKARRYLKVIDKKNPDLRKFLLEEITEDYIEENYTPDGYRPYTIGEVLDFIERAQYLVVASAGAMLWMESEFKKMATKTKPKTKTKKKK